MIRTNNQAQINLAIQTLKCNYKLFIKYAVKIYIIDFSFLSYYKRGLLRDHHRDPSKACHPNNAWQENIIIFL